MPELRPLYDSNRFLATKMSGLTPLKKPENSIAAKRKFAFKHKQSQEKVELISERGSLLVKEKTWKVWQIY